MLIHGKERRGEGEGGEQAAKDKVREHTKGRTEIIKNNQVDAKVIIDERKSMRHLKTNE